MHNHEITVLIIKLLNTKDFHTESVCMYRENIGSGTVHITISTKKKSDFIPKFLGDKHYFSSIPDKFFK